MRHSFSRHEILMLPLSTPSNSTEKGLWKRTTGTFLESSMSIISCMWPIDLTASLSACNIKCNIFLLWGFSPLFIYFFLSSSLPLPASHSSSCLADENHEDPASAKSGLGLPQYPCSVTETSFAKFARLEILKLCLS